jgi:DNA-binding NarL/FixJ family response regulator
LTGRVLVVDDHEAWRAQIGSILRKSDGWRIVGEAADGREAVEKAEALRPDLILLDIELPAMNGLEAARRILAVNPHARILFVTGHRSWDVAEAGLATGARGYILKVNAGNELVPAMEAIAANERFISPTLAGRSEERYGRRSHRHEAAFYSDDTRLLDDYARFAGAALDAGKAFIVVAEESRRDDLHDRLRADGIDLDLVIRQRRYLSIGVPDALSPFMVDGWPDEARFWKAATSLIMGAARASRGPHPGVAACGDGVATLLRDGKADAAIRLEQLWDELARTYNVDVLCGYSTAAAPYDMDRDIVQRIRDAHTAVHSR